MPREKLKNVTAMTVRIPVEFMERLRIRLAQDGEKFQSKTLELLEGYGPPGIRDRNGVEAGLSRPQEHWHYAGVRDVFQLAAIYVESFATTQHSVDGNKRVPLHSALCFCI